ncbi:MAG: LuxR family transcriptional regulator [Bacillota bacterium]|nr:MAG: LuxR family transcriptional regulator [Bacillota bacterium]
MYVARQISHEKRAGYLFDNLLSHLILTKCVNLMTLPAALGLSPREVDVLRLVGEGFSNEEIGEKLYLSSGTVRNYVSVLLEKLTLRDRTQLAIFYNKHF